MADVSANKGERNDGRAGNQTAAQHPGIAHWISKWPNEKQRDNEMPEREPVGPISDEWKFSVGLFQSEEDEGNPGPRAGNQVIRGGIVDAEPAAKKRKFVEQWKRRQAAQDKSGDEEAQTYPVCEKCAFQRTQLTTSGTTAMRLTRMFLVGTPRCAPSLPCYEAQGSAGSRPPG